MPCNPLLEYLYVKRHVEKIKQPKGMIAQAGTQGHQGWGRSIDSGDLRSHQ